MSYSGVPTLKSLAQICRDSGQRKGQGIHFTFLKQGEKSEDNLSFEELDCKASHLAQMLSGMSLKGKKVLLLFEPGLDFITTFMGCLYAQVIPIPIYPPNPMRLERTLPRFQYICQDSGPACILTTERILGSLDFIFNFAPNLRNYEWIAADKDYDAPINWEIPQSSIDSLAFIQYTSGTQAEPKGVPITNQELMTCLEQLKLKRQGDEQNCILSWLPFYHDLGLVGAILFPVFLSCRSILMSPISFIRNPMTWLKAIHYFKADTTAAPNFALDLCLRKLEHDKLAELDLSTLKMCLVGSDVLQAETLSRFCETMAPCGLKKEAIFPGYGQAETVLSVASGSIHRPYKKISFQREFLQKGQARPASNDDDGIILVSCGFPMDHLTLEIVDPLTKNICSNGQVGEIWVSSQHLPNSYLSGSHECFQASINGQSKEGYFKTGDSGFIWDGELFVLGRIAEGIEIDGRSYRPMEFESLVESSPVPNRPGCLAAFASLDSSRPGVIILAELDKTSQIIEGREHEPLDQFKDHVETLLMKKYPFPCYLYFVPKDAVEKTSSGKIRRTICQQKFFSQKIKTL